ncbi:uncharacterized protein LOC6591956 [Drosophila persimilis]|uniref:uncharacterized protein LOC6591956 n=1 Tax=Drosophila persimilis TaxID=7234 RepID=UPI000F097CAA|nr:uncharacterized protein LOC6591956 [Drosophila persimilis]
MHFAKIIILLLSVHESCLALYIKRADKMPEATRRAGGNAKARKDEWGVFQSTLGLSQEKIDLLKSQKDQQGTKELLNRFIRENSKMLMSQKTTNRDEFTSFYRSVLKKLTASKGMLKTSLNFELENDDKPLKPMKRSRRKIAIKMVSDVPSENVDYLLKMFYQKHKIHSNYHDRDHIPTDSDKDTEYDFDNLYDDEGDVGLIAKSRQSTEYGSFQDLIMQSKMIEWERENEETKLHSSSNDHFI